MGTCYYYDLNFYKLNQKHKDQNIQLNKTQSRFQISQKHSLKNDLGRGSKKRVEFSIKAVGWGQQWTDIPCFLFVFFWRKKNVSLNSLKFPKNHCKTNIFLVGGPSSAMIVRHGKSGFQDWKNYINSCSSSS